MTNQTKSEQAVTITSMGQKRRMIGSGCIEAQDGQIFRKKDLVWVIEQSVRNSMCFGCGAVTAATEELIDNGMLIDSRTIDTMVFEALGQVSS